MIDNQAIYEEEIAQSIDVKRLKNAYLDKFFREKYIQVHEHIAALPLGQTDALVIAHHQLKSLAALETEIQSYIDSGKLAAISLDEYTT
jgi:hypothetical protein